MSKVCNVFLEESNWKKVITLKSEHESLMLCNSMASIEE